MDQRGQGPDDSLIARAVAARISITRDEIRIDDVGGHDDEPPDEAAA